MLTERAYAGEADREAVMELWLSARAAEAGDPWPKLDDLAAQLAAAPCGCADVQLWEERHRGLVGAAMLIDGCILVWWTHAGADDEALESQMLGWGRGRVAQGADSPGEIPSLFVPVNASDTRLTALLERAGFQEDGWRTLRMARSLQGPIVAPEVPDGLVIRAIAGASDIAAVTALHNQLFAGGRKTSDERAALMRGPEYRASLDLIAELPDGTAVGYALGSCCAIERRRLGRALGWVEFVGVAPERRGGGVGRALVRRLLGALRAEGVELALLTTGAANVAARHLFESCGFSVRHEVRWYVEAQGRRG